MYAASAGCKQCCAYALSGSGRQKTGRSRSSMIWPHLRSKSSLSGRFGSLRSSACRVLGKARHTAAGSSSVIPVTVDYKRANSRVGKREALPGAGWGSLKAVSVDKITRSAPATLGRLGEEFVVVVVRPSGAGGRSFPGLGYRACRWTGRIRNSPGRECASVGCRPRGA